MMNNIMYIGYRWFFTSGTCFDEDNSWRKMNLHMLAEEGEFCCKNGLCIDSERRCDDSIDCVDHSDEEDCNLVIFPTFKYNPEMPPAPKTIKRFPSLNISQSTDIFISVELFSILDINEVTSEVSMIFSIFLKWRDSRLRYLYLINDLEKNVVDKDIWIPDLVFGNPKEQLSEFKGKMKVEKLGKFQTNTRDKLAMEEIYEGSENPISLKNFYQVKFICIFNNIDLYPFDVETCTIDIVNAGNGNKFIKLIPKNVENYALDSIAQYTIEGISFVNVTFTKELSGVQVRIELGRDFRSIFCVTLLPTILMNIINQATNYLDNTKFLEAIITVNITCMMVLSALYISISTSLPATSNIKYIDIWLLFSLIFPFFIILINILLYQIKQKEFSCSSLVKIGPQKNKTRRTKSCNMNVESALKFTALYLNPFIYIIFTIIYLLYGKYCLQ